MLEKEVLKKCSENNLVSCGYNFATFLSQGKATVVFKIGGNPKLFIRQLHIEQVVQQFSCNFNIACYLDTNGYVWIMDTLVKNVQKEHFQFQDNPTSLKLPTLMKSIVAGINIYMIGIDSSLWKLHCRSKLQKIENFQVKQISCGNNFVMIICNDDSIWSKGNNEYGQLGLGDYSKRDDFTRMETEEKIISIASGNDHSLFLTNIQRVYSCGRNHCGQLGIAKHSLPMETISTLCKIEELSLITTIACQFQRSFCVASNGSLYAFGESFHSIVKVNIPPVQYISSGRCDNTIVQDKFGFIWSLGSFKDNEEYFIRLGSIWNQEFKNLCKNINNFETVFDKVDKLRKNYVSSKGCRSL